MVEAVERLCRELKAEFSPGEHLAARTSLGIGGEALFAARPASWSQAAALLEKLWAENIPFKVLGGGTNLLVEDGRLGFGVVHLRACGGTARFTDDEVEVDADVPLPSLCSQAMRKGLAGLEGLAGIPGLVGGAVVMNAGAYGTEISSLATSVALIERGAGLRWHDASSFRFAYRASDVSSRGVVAGCKIRLRRDEPSAITSRFEEFKARRLATQPWKLPSAGSVFKNPSGDAAGRILEELGFKGKRRGGAAFSEIHANFLVNLGGATFADAWSLCEEARETAARRGTALEYEMEVWRRAQ